MRKKNITVFALVIVLIGVAIWNNYNRSHSTTNSYKPELPAKTGAQVGELAPIVKLKTLDGKPFTIGGKQEKPVFLNFWASWCGPCKNEAPDLVTLYHKYKDKLEMVCVNVTSNDTEEGIKEFVATFGISNPVPLDVKGKAFKAYHGIGLPTNILIDKNGIIRERYTGAKPIAAAEKAIKKLIGHK